LLGHEMMVNAVGLITSDSADLCDQLGTISKP
jgi:hypothetical protein